MNFELARRPSRANAVVILLAAIGLTLMFAVPTAARATYQFVSKWEFPSGLGWAPAGLAISPATGDVYVADYGGNRIYRFAPDGTHLGDWGGSGTGDGQFNTPMGVATDSAGNLYVADLFNYRIQKFGPDGQFVAKWGANSGDGSPGSGNREFDQPTGVAVGTDGSVFVADSGNHRIQKLDPSGNFLTEWGTEGTGDDQFGWPGSVTVDAAGSVYVFDQVNSRVQRFTPTGDFVTKWGGPGTGDGQFGVPTRRRAAAIHEPYFGIATSASGDVYVADYPNARVQKFTSSGAFQEKWGGDGVGDGQFFLLAGLDVDASGDVLVTSFGRVQRFRFGGGGGDEGSGGGGGLGGDGGSDGGGGGGATDPFSELPANDLLFACDERKIAIQFLERKGKKARVDGLAASSLIGEKVELAIKAKSKSRGANPKPTTTVVEAGGSFSGAVKLPKGEAAVRKAQVYATAAKESSRFVKLTRRARLTKAVSAGGKTTLTGKVLTRRAKKPPALTVRRRVACKGENQWVDVAKGKQKADGSFKVSFGNPADARGSIFDVATKYATKDGAKANKSTATWAVAIDLG